MKTQKFSMRKVKGFGLVGAAIATMFLAQTAMADVQNGQFEPGTSTTQVQPTEPQVDTSAETFNKRLDAIESYIKQDVANNLNESMTAAVNSYNSIDANNQVTAPKVTADDVTLTYDRSKLALTDDYKFTKSPVAISYNVANNDYMDTYSKMQPTMTNIKNLVADPIVLGTTPKKASEPKAIDDNNTMIAVTRGTRTINYRIEETGNTALASIKQIVTFYSPFVTPKNVHNQLSPSTDKTEAKETRFETVDGATIKDAVKGFVEAPTVIADKYQYTGQSKMNDAKDVLTYLYTTIEHSIPGEAPILDKPDYKIESEVPKDAPILDKPEFNGGVTPNDAPALDKPELKIEEAVPSDAPVLDKPEFNGGVTPNDAPVLDKPELKIDEPSTPTTPETPKVPENTTSKELPKTKESAESTESVKTSTAKSTADQTAPVTEAAKATDRQLPQTGTAKNILAVIGVVMLALGLVARKKEQD